MELFSHVPDAAGEHLLHKHMDILALHIKGELAGFQVFQDIRQSVNDLLCLCLGDDVFRPQHCRVGHGACDVLPEHPAVEMDGGIEIIRQLTGHAVRPPGPHFCHENNTPCM